MPRQGGQRGLSPEPRQAITRFVEWVLDRSGLSQSELAAQAGLLASTVSDYKRGKNAPNFFNTLKLLRAAGALDHSAPVPADSLEGRLAAIEVQQAEIAQATEQAVASILARIERQLDGTAKRQPQRRTN